VEQLPHKQLLKQEGRKMSHDLAGHIGSDYEHDRDKWRGVNLTKQTRPANVVKCHEHDRT
jgi:hypothetical protein